MNSKPSSTWRPMVAAAALALASGAQAAESGAVVVRDADSGQLRAATAQENRELQNQGQGRAAQSRTRAAASPRGVVSGSAMPRQWVAPTGGVIAETTEDMASAMVVRRSADGKLVRQCAGTLAQAQRMMDGRVVSFAKNMVERQHEVK